MLKVLDVKTRAMFDVPLNNTVTLRCKDGVAVRLHPNTVELMVRKGETFHGQTVKGQRELKRIK